MKTVGILGGMGSMATVDLFKKIVQNTKVSCDQDHLHIIIDNYSKIPDRTDFILNGHINPLPKMIEAALRLERTGVDMIAMPCNTAHFFYEDIQNIVHIPVLHMMRETSKIIKKKTLLLATEGTYKAKLYQDVFMPNDTIKKQITELIYQYKIDQTSNEKTKQAILHSSHDMDSIILGCTELPLIFRQTDTDIPLVDPTEILAKAIIKKAGGQLKATP